MNSSYLTKSGVPVFPNRPTPVLNGYDSSIRHSYPPTGSSPPADQQLPQKRQTGVSKVIVLVVAFLLILVSLAIVLPIVITKTKSQSDRIELPLTSRKDFETTSSLNSLRQSAIQRSSESGKKDVTTRSLFPSKTNSETVHLQTSRSLFQFQSSAESSAQMTTAKSGHYTTTQKSVTSKQSHDQTSSFKLQTSRTFYESSTANRQYSSTVSACQVFCSPTQSCIPPNQVCDKTQDCPDDSDEINCNCDRNHYPCQNGRCIYKAWLCDGVRDCPMGDDESTSRCGSCNISTDFRCNRTPSVCVASKKQCDGVSDCVDSSDESHCINVFNEEMDSSNTSLLNVTFQGTSGYYICSENWNDTLSDSICRQMGQKDSKTTKFENVNNNASFLLALNLSVSSSNPLDYLQPGVCSSNEAVAVNCQPPVCGSRSASLDSIGPYILNGQQARRGAWPWFALLQQGVYSSSGGAFSQTASCGSVLVNSRWILTAAHCNVAATSNLGYSGKLRPENIQISLGVLTRGAGSSDSLNARVDKVFVHPLYNTTPNTVNDIGLLRLSTPVNLTDAIRPICLPSPYEDLSQIRVCVDVGFGRTLRNEPSYDLLQARMNILSYSECYNYLKNSFLKDQSQFCSGTLPTEADINFCIGDSGGPLSCQDQQGVWKVLGINSYVLGQNNNQAVATCVVSVSSRVTYFLDWIQQTIALNSD